MTRSQREAAILAELRGGPLHFDMIKIGGRHSHAHETELRRMAKAGLVRRRRDGRWECENDPLTLGEE